MTMNRILRRATLVATLSVCLIPAASPAYAQNWGSLSGQFILDGDVPEMVTVPVSLVWK